MAVRAALVAVKTVNLFLLSEQCSWIDYIFYQNYWAVSWWHIPCAKWLLILYLDILPFNCVWSPEVSLHNKTCPFGNHLYTNPYWSRLPCGFITSVPTWCHQPPSDVPQGSPLPACWGRTWPAGWSGAWRRQRGWSSGVQSCTSPALACSRSHCPSHPENHISSGLFWLWVKEEEEILSYMRLTKVPSASHLRGSLPSLSWSLPTSVPKLANAETFAHFHHTSAGRGEKWAEMWRT